MGRLVQVVKEPRASGGPLAYNTWAGRLHRDFPKGDIPTLPLHHVLNRISHLRGGYGRKWKTAHGLGTRYVKRKEL